MIDVLICTRHARVAVIELKTHDLPLQGLDYRSRVGWQHQRGEFQKFGYSPKLELSPEPPLLFLVAPAVRVHPVTDPILVFRKRSPQIAARAA